MRQGQTKVQGRDESSTRTLTSKLTGLPHLVWHQGMDPIRQRSAWPDGGLECQIWADRFTDKRLLGKSDVFFSSQRLFPRSSIGLGNSL